MKKDPLIFIKHIRDAIDLVEEFTEEIEKNNFVDNKLIQSAVVRQI